ncbi:STM4015 family protein [Deinococcus sp.]|uniref:STM4015 family protein n=1 Tax=Deinococcus sp. TaxID=47478 RepID=UPI003C7B536A
MTINAHLTEFAGFQVTLWEPGQPLGDPATIIHRLAVEFDDETNWTAKFRAFLELPGVAETQGLVVGMWDAEAGSEGDPGKVVEALVTAHAHLPKLRALFMNDITFEENEVSWIPNGDLSPIFASYPGLEHLGIRGGNGLSVGRLALPALKTLIIQAGGLSAEAVREVMSAELPQLEHLELYLGTDNYGATNTPEDLAPLLDGKLFSRLRYLGLKNSDHQDQIAQIVANAPVLDGLETLDLSMGILTDEGAAALIASPKVAKLRKLDVSFHWCSDEMMAKLEALPIEVDASDQQEFEDDWRYVSLGE